MGPTLIIAQYSKDNGGPPPGAIILPPHFDISGHFLSDQSPSIFTLLNVDFKVPAEISLLVFQWRREASRTP